MFRLFKMAEVAPICCFQRIVLYETKARFYLVGSNNSETRFRVLKIDRTEPRELVLSDDKVEYSRQQIKQLLTTINAGNMVRPSKPYETSTKGLHRSISAYGILGFVRFLEGYYIILITERRKQAQIGGHTIYKIEDTRMVSIPNEAVIQKFQHPDESRYVRIFQNVDLSSNFYYSYSYDLTQTLQHNMAPLLNPNPVSSSAGGLWEALGYCTCDHGNKDADTLVSGNRPGKDNLKDDINCTPKCKSAVDSCDDVEEKDSMVDGLASSKLKSSTSLGSENSTNKEQCAKTGITSRCDEEKPSDICSQCKKLRKRGNNATVAPDTCKKISKPYYKFVWNKHLLSGLEEKVHQDWVLYVINGFIGQSNICVYGKPIYVTLIARRSAEFAGTRFLKRGANDEGYVANEVETEQIVHDASVLSFESGHYTSYAQLRGSVPTYWSQDMKQVMVPKPQISVDRADPYCNAPSKHVNHLFERFGAPLVILNLVKKRERKRHEQILSEELQSAVDYLNQFLPVEFHIKYIAWDMARFNKSKDLAVIEKLTVIADQVFKTTGFFHSCPQLYCNDVRRDRRWDHMGGILYSDTGRGRGQNGVLRVNCVDCLDRTNTAQFMVGKCALGFQLYALGVIESPSVEFDSDAVRIIEDLYEAHGDTLALQYGGSQLVKGIRTYRKVSPFTSHSHDIMQTISRYYSNAFNDADKQQAMNVFLGVFVPQAGKSNIWDMTTDYYLHHSSTCNLKALKKRRSYTTWLDENVLNSLPHPVWEGLCMGVLKLDAKQQQLMCLSYINSVSHEEQDIFSEFYRPHEMSMFDTLYPLTMQKSCKDFMPATCNDHSPFIVRDRFKTPTHRRVPVRKAVAAAPVIPAEDSSDDGGSSDEDKFTTLSPEKDSANSISFVSFQDLMPSMKDVYGVELCHPNGKDQNIYDRYAEFGKNAERNSESSAKYLKNNWKKHKPYSHDSVRQVKLPSVDTHSQMLYTGYTKNHAHFGITLNSSSLLLYREYCKYY